MMTLLGALLGFISSTMPDVFRLYQSNRDREHELAVMDRQMELQKLGLNQRLEEISIQSDNATLATAYQTYKTGIGWVDAFNGTVRPALAYGFFLLYALMKIAQFGALGRVASPFDLLAIMWGNEDQAIFAAIISFYFGQRAMRKK